MDDIPNFTQLPDNRVSEATAMLDDYAGNANWSDFEIRFYGFCGHQPRTIVTAGGLWKNIHDLPPADSEGVQLTLSQSNNIQAKLP